jgi:hypothetical protein
MGTLLLVLLHMEVLAVEERASNSNRTATSSSSS